MVEFPDPEERYYKLNRILLSIIGLWPRQTPRERWPRISLLFLLLMSRIIPEVAALVKHENDFDQVVHSMTALGCAGLCVIKMVNLIMNREKAKDLLIRMRKSWENVIYDPKIKIMKQYAKNSLRFTKRYTCACVAVGIVSGVPVVLDVLPANSIVVDPKTNITKLSSRLVVISGYGVDDETYFYPILFHRYFTSIVMNMIFLSADTIFANYAQHGCTKFRLLKYRLSQIIQPGELDCELHPQEIDDLVFHEIKLSIKSHKEAIEFADAFESMYSMSQFFQVSLCCLLISIDGLCMVTKINTPIELVSFVVITVLTMAAMLFYCWPCQNLMDQSLGVSEAVYSMEWYRTSIRSRKLLLQIMTRSGESCKITVGGLYVMSTENYTNILSSSYSYFTMLSTLRDQSAGTK